MLGRRAGERGNGLGDVAAAEGADQLDPVVEDAAESAYQLAVQRYRAGLGSYLVVLSAEGTVLAQRRLGVDLKARALDNQVQLTRALGGGYVAEPIPALASAAPQP